MRKKLRMLLTAALLVVFLAACGQSTQTEANEARPVITVGGENYPPFADMDNNGTPTGLDIDILTEAFDRVGYDVRFVHIQWEDKDELLASGEIDCVTGGFTIDGREDDYLWIGPYMNSNQAVAVNEGSDIHSLGDLKGKTVAVQAATIAEKILLENGNPNAPQAVQLFSFENSTLLFAALGCDYVDAIVADEPVIIQYMNDYGTTFTILDEPLTYAKVGTAFAKDGDAQLCEQVNAAIDAMREDGTLDTIIQSHTNGTNK